jgi:hypothetical protein
MTDQQELGKSVGELGEILQSVKILKIIRDEKGIYRLPPMARTRRPQTTYISK